MTPQTFEVSRIPRYARPDRITSALEVAMECRRNPLHCILPPFVLESIAAQGDDGQRAWAARALNRDQSIRLARVQNAKVRGRGPREGADALAVQPGADPRRVIRDAEGKEDVHGKVVRREGENATGDEAADQAYDGLGQTFAFYNEVFGRNSIDDAGMPLRGVVHFAEDYANAFWDGRRMVFGDGDGQVCGPMTASIDVIGHELAHGVTEDEAGLEYAGQSGALNESASDVFGSLVEQHGKQQKAEAADWLIGDEVWTPNISGDALRSMKAPGTAYDDPLIGKDRQPAHMDDYVETVQDNGGVHINSGVPNHAFYTVATELGGYAWERAGRIWYETLQDATLRPNATFERFAAITVGVAVRLHGEGSAEANAVYGGWEKVGVTVPKP
jgi:Zn-dependent metalloprotease